MAETAFEKPLFHDRIAVVTGAGSGIGRAISCSLAYQGATVCLVGRRTEPLNTIAQELPADVPVPISCPTDLTSDTAIDQLVTQIQQKWGYLDLLVHSAGVFAMGRIDTAPIAEFDRQYRTNVRAPYLLTQRLLPMLKSRQGQVVFINSTVGLSPSRAGVCQYAATKHALKAVADSLREEVNADGIRVLSIYPGRTASPMQAEIHAMEGKPYYPDRLIQPETIADLVLHTLSLPRNIEVTDITTRPLAKPQSA